MYGAEEPLKICGFDPSEGVRSEGEFAQGLHPEDIETMRRRERPVLSREAGQTIPTLGAFAKICLRASWQQRWDAGPFAMVALIFVAAFGTLAISFWPYMIPFSITVEAAAAPHSSLAFMFWGAGLFVFPLMLIYTAINFSVFRGKVRPSSDNYHP
jgi:cytochrome bd ubiquinol oxidase subunit II